MGSAVVRHPVAIFGAAAVVAAVVMWATAPLAWDSGPLLLDPGPIVRGGLFVATLVRDLAGATTIGAALLGATVLNRKTADTVPAARHLPQVVFVASIVWSIAAMVHIVLAFADVSVPDWADPTIANQLMYTVTSIPMFQYFAVATICAVVASVVAAAGTGPLTMFWVAALGTVSWFCVSLTGHAAGAGNHELAVSAWWLHALGVSGWCGGVFALVAIRCGWGKIVDADLMIIRRFSEIALWSAIVVWISGVASAALRIARPADLLTNYGALTLAKVGLTILLIGAGFVHRRWVINRATDGKMTTSRLFTTVLSAEVIVFSAVMAVASVLSRTAPPVPDTEIITDSLSPAEIVTGSVLPPWPEGAQWVIQWKPDVLWWGLAVLLAGQYLAAVFRLWERGDAWPVWRLVMWLLAMVGFVYLTTGAPAVYGHVLFSAHMLQHMLLSMGLPLMLVMAAPVTLLLRAVPPRTDGTMGWREWTLWLVRSPWAKLLSNPIVAAVNFAGSILVFYYSGLFELALSTHVGHLLMTVHFVLVGYIFAEVLVGADPGVDRPSHPVRLVLLFATMGFHAFFGVGISNSEQLLAATYFSSLGWGIDLLQDQRLGGGIAWGVGEVPTLVLALLVAVDWRTSDTRRARQLDRAADRDDEAELRAYNEMLGQMGGAEPESQPTSADDQKQTSPNPQSGEHSI